MPIYLLSLLICFLASSFITGQALAKKYIITYENSDDEMDSGNSSNMGKSIRSDGKYSVLKNSAVNLHQGMELNPYVERFTATTIHENELRLGTLVDYGLSENVMIGTNLLALISGIPILHTKWMFFQNFPHTFATGIDLGYFNKNSLLWGAAKEHFKTLNGTMVRPFINWTYQFAAYSKLHTSWAFGFGDIDVELSEKGKQKLKDIKYPNSEEETQSDEAGSSTPTVGDDDDAGPDDNIEKSTENKSSFARRTLSVGSISGLARDVFKAVWEHKIDRETFFLMTNSISRIKLEGLKANTYRISLSQVWLWETFSITFGLGGEYLVVSGTDLDGEKISDDIVHPVGELSFFWKF